MTALEPAAAEETSTSAAPAISPALDFAAGTVAGPSHRSDLVQDGST